MFQVVCYCQQSADLFLSSHSSMRQVSNPRSVICAAVMSFSPSLFSLFSLGKHNRPFLLCGQMRHSAVSALHLVTSSSVLLADLQKNFGAITLPLSCKCVFDSFFVPSSLHYMMLIGFCFFGGGVRFLFFASSGNFFAGFWEIIKNMPGRILVFTFLGHGKYLKM